MSRTGLLVLAGLVTASIARGPTAEQLKGELKTLRDRYAQLQQTLENETEKRWSLRQEQIDAKEGNKGMVETAKQNIERAYSEVSRSREQLLAGAAALEQKREQLAGREEDFRFALQALVQKVDDEEKRNLVIFPLGQQERMGALSALRSQMSSADFHLPMLEAFLRYKEDKIRKSRRIQVVETTVLIQGTDPHPVKAVAVGSVFAYGLESTGVPYFLGNTGKTGDGAFEWNRIENPEMASFIQKHLPAWIAAGKLVGAVPVDVIQNRYSATLVAAGKKSPFGAFADFARAGGIILIPLLGIVLWALFIVQERWRSYNRRSGYRATCAVDAIAKLESGDKAAARALVSNVSDPLSRVVKVCVDKSDGERDAAEKAVTEELLPEIADLDRGLDTLGVIAGAAPLLGLLGTVTGMIRMFEAITKFGTGDPKLLAGGISEALVTTEVGLAIAIPVLLVHNLLSNRRNRIQSQLEAGALRVLNRLWPE